ncbi:MAG: hypothetical protein J5611_02265 [Alphaproteobacteria bacterium]|nr:hypothetical protein [Alphaproteobacteria bacterium]
MVYVLDIVSPGHRERFYDAQTMTLEHEKMFYKSLEREHMNIGCFEYNLAGPNNALALVVRFDIGPWFLWHTCIKDYSYSEQIMLHNPNIWSIIYMNDRFYDSGIPNRNNYLIKYYDAINNKLQADFLLRRKKEIFEQCAQEMFFNGLSYEECLKKIKLLQQWFDHKMKSLGEYL